MFRLSTASAALVISVTLATSAAPAAVAHTASPVPAAAAPTSSDGTARAATPLQNPSPDQIAATLYVQARGLGLGDVAALAAIVAGLAETGLSNNADGDCWSVSSCTTRTPARGVFMQYPSWSPKGTAWSGKIPYRAPSADFSDLNAQNAWTPDGWALNDPRMNVAQAANMFFRGPSYNAKGGLEDQKLFAKVRGVSPGKVSAATVAQLVASVQGIPPAYVSELQRLVPLARKYLSKAQTGKYVLPPFTPPINGLR